MEKNTMEMEIEHHFQHEQKKAIGDIVVALSDRAWTRGWIIGFVSGAALVVVIEALSRMV